jgi:hypothetical protein
VLVSAALAAKDKEENAHKIIIKARTTEIGFLMFFISKCSFKNINLHPQSPNKTSKIGCCGNY